MTSVDFARKHDLRAFSMNAYLMMCLRNDVLESRYRALLHQTAARGLYRFVGNARTQRRAAVESEHARASTEYWLRLDALLREIEAL